MYQFAHEAALESAKVTCIVCGEAKEKVENWLNLRIGDESVVYSIMRLKGKDIDSQSCYPGLGKCQTCLMLFKR